MGHSEIQELGKDYLMHHGTLGMKWGIRRYQNEDGSLTNAGKKDIQNMIIMQKIRI